MECSWTEERIVALQDDELTRSERAIVLEHLESCAECAALEAQLAGITPFDALQVPDAVQQRLAAAVDAAIEETLAEPWSPVAPGRLERARRWLRRDRDLSNGAMLAYAAALAICLGWGLSNYVAIQSEQAPAALAHAPATVSGDHYQPASYALEEGTEGDDEEGWR